MKPLLAVLAVAALAAAEAPPSPPININVVDPKTAPEVAESAQFTARIVVQNPYDKAVKVASTDTTCTCARLELRDRFLLPRQTSEIEIAIDNHMLSGPQRLGISLYLSDPGLEPIEVVALWTVRAHIQVDSLAGSPPGATTRPQDVAYRDIYRYISKERPDELGRLRKRILLTCPPGELPEGGLKVLGVDYAGEVWAFDTEPTADGGVLLTARARDVAAELKPGLREEAAVVRTNHPRKASFELTFITYLGKDAGQVVIDPDAQRDKVKPAQ